MMTMMNAGGALLLAARRAASAAAGAAAAASARPRIASATRWSQRVPHRAFSTEKVSFTFVDADGNSVPVSAPLGETLLDVAQENDVELEGALQLVS